MTALSFVLSTGLIALLGSWFVAAVLVVLPAPAPKCTPAERADRLVWRGVLPAVLGCTLGAAIAMPSLLFVLGLGSDHCLEHSHHPHLCWFHAAPLHEGLAVLGALLLGSTGFRALYTLGTLWKSERLGWALSGLGRAEGDLIWVPGDAALCHVTGVLKPRVLLGERLAEELDTAALQAAIGHERAHVARRDPACGALVQLCGAFTPPLLHRFWFSRWRQAAEEAADAQAAVQVGAAQVAQALLRVARLRPPSTGGIGFGELGLEARVVRLLHEAPACSPSRVSWGLACLGALALGLVLLAYPSLHHGAEEVWELVLRAP